MATEKISFKHYKPTPFYIVNVCCVLFLIASVFLLMQYLSFFVALELGFILFAITMGLLYVAEKKFSDLKGSFTMEEEAFEITTFGIHDYVRYSAITSIKKECYSHSVTIVNINAAQVNPGQYRICLNDNKKYIFRIAHSEEKTYLKAIQGLTTKIYNTNRLGVHLNTKKFRAKMADSEKEVAFEKGKPMPAYSLQKAMNLLLQKSGIELIDLTV